MKANFIFMSVYSKIKSCTLWTSTELSTLSQDIEWYSVEVNFTRMSGSAKIKNCSIKFNFIDSVLFYKGKERYSIEINFIGMSVSTKIKSSIRWKSSSMSVYSKIWIQLHWHIRLFSDINQFSLEVSFIGMSVYL